MGKIKIIGKNKQKTVLPQFLCDLLDPSRLHGEVAGPDEGVLGDLEAVPVAAFRPQVAPCSDLRKRYNGKMLVNTGVRFNRLFAVWGYFGGHFWAIFWVIFGASNISFPGLSSRSYIYLYRKSLGPLLGDF